MHATASPMGSFMRRHDERTSHDIRNLTMQSVPTAPRFQTIITMLYFLNFLHDSTNLAPGTWNTIISQLVCLGVWLYIG